MASTLTRILLHIVFSTKGRIDLIPPELEADLYAYIGGICRRMHSVLLDMGGTANHVHMFVNLGKTVALSDLMLHVKRDSSKWIKSQSPKLKGHHWQDGYFTFSIGESGAAGLKRYIANQKTHHKKVDFKDEVRALLQKYGMEGDERYMWD